MGLACYLNSPHQDATVTVLRLRRAQKTQGLGLQWKQRFYSQIQKSVSESLCLGVRINSHGNAHVPGQNSQSYWEQPFSTGAGGASTSNPGSGQQRELTRPSGVGWGEQWLMDRFCAGPRALGPWVKASVGPQPGHCPHS